LSPGGEEEQRLVEASLRHFDPRLQTLGLTSAGWTLVLTQDGEGTDGCRVSKKASFRKGRGLSKLTSSFSEVRGGGEEVVPNVGFVGAGEVAALDDRFHKACVMNARAADRERSCGVRHVFQLFDKGKGGVSGDCVWGERLGAKGSFAIAKIIDVPNGWRESRNALKRESGTGERGAGKEEETSARNEVKTTELCPRNTCRGLRRNKACFGHGGTAGMRIKQGNLRKKPEVLYSGKDKAINRRHDKCFVIPEVAERRAIFPLPGVSTAGRDIHEDETFPPFRGIKHVDELHARFKVALNPDKAHVPKRERGNAAFLAPTGVIVLAVVDDGGKHGFDGYD